MTLPLSGPLEASDINVELGRSATAVMSITDAATGVYATINTCSPYFPNGTAPHAYSEWYGYNHLAPCLNSNFAFFDDINTGTEDMLYSFTRDYWTIVSSSRPSPASTMTVSFWMKMVNPGGVNRGGLMELSPITPGSSTQLLEIYWDLDENTLSPGTYDANVIFIFTNASGSSVTSKVNLADANNSSISGINPNNYWDNSNTGYVDVNGYSLITIVIDYSAIGTSTYATWYWNDSPLTVTWQTAPADGSSFTFGSSSFSGPNWTNNRLYVGGIFNISAECQLDGFAIFLQTALVQTDVTSIYNGGAVAPIASYTGISSELLFYNFENDTPSIGIDTGGTYSMDLNERNTPFRVQDPAA
jgi:hypothetical protein